MFIGKYKNLLIFLLSLISAASLFIIIFQATTIRKISANNIVKPENHYYAGHDYKLKHIIENSKNCEIDVDYPELYLSGNINNEIKKFVDKIVIDFKEGFDCDDPNGFAGGANTLNFHFKDYSFQNDNSVIEVVFEYGDHYYMAPRESYYLQSFNYDLRDDKVISDLFR